MALILRLVLGGFILPIAAGVPGGPESFGDEAALFQLTSTSYALSRSASETSSALLEFLDSYVNATHALDGEDAEGDMAGFLSILRGPGKSFWDTLMGTVQKSGIPGLVQPGDWMQVGESLMANLPEGGKHFMKKDMAGTPGVTPSDLMQLFPLTIMSLPALSQSGLLWHHNYHGFQKKTEENMKRMSEVPPTSAAGVRARLDGMKDDINGRYGTFSDDMKKQMVYFGPLMLTMKAVVPGLPDIRGARKLLNERFEGGTMMGGLLDSGTYWNMAGDPIKLNIDLNEANRQLVEATAPRELREEHLQHAKDVIAINRQLKSKQDFVDNWATALLQFVDLYDTRFKQGVGMLGLPLYSLVGGIFQVMRNIIKSTQMVMRAFTDNVHKTTESFGLTWMKPGRQ